MWKRLVLSLFSSLLLGWAVTVPALATELPPGVVNYLTGKDPQVKIRFDGLVIFSNGESYMPVIPQDPSLAGNPQHVIRTIPEGKDFPDFVEFDNHFFLMRLIQTQSGRLTFPKLAEYPIELKEGLLPQDLVLPNNLFIPVELKVILGALPYNPKFVPTEAAPPPAFIELSQVRPPAGSAHTGTFSALNSNLYLFDLTNQKVVSVEPSTGRVLNDMALDCIPSSLKMSPDGKLVFASCLSTNELVAIDTAANLVKTRIPVGNRPEFVLYVKPLQQVLVSHRFSDFLSLVNASDLLPGTQIKLPGNGGVMAADAKATYVYVADVSKPVVYQINLSTRTVEKTLPALANVSAMLVIPGASGRDELWVASRTEHQVQAIDPVRGTVLQTVKVGEKPVDMAQDGNKLYVVSAKDARLDVIDLTAKALMAPIALQMESFPSDIAIVQPNTRAYVSTAGAETLYILDLHNGRLESSLPLTFRSTAITLVEPDAAQATPAATEPTGAPLSEGEKNAGTPRPEQVLQVDKQREAQSEASVKTPAEKPKKRNKKTRAPRQEQAAPVEKPTSTTQAQPMNGGLSPAETMVK